MANPTVIATRLTLDDLPEIVEVFADAFRDYPVMRYTLGTAARYEARLVRLVELFAGGRAYRREPMFGVRDSSGRLVAAAVTTSPVPPDPPVEFLALRETIWSELGSAARARYEECVSAWAATAISEPHHHLNMIGVAHSHQGRGHARLLLTDVHGLATTAGGASTGVSLTTEVPANVRLYGHFGYAVVGHVRVSPELETWTLFRPSSTVGR